MLAAAPDANVQGFKAYEKGDIRKAHGLFEKALKKDPANPYARLNRARTTTLLQHAKDVDDYCDFASNWVYLALADLSTAVETDRAAILPKIDEDQKGLKALKESDEYKKWRKAVSVLAEEKGVADAVLGASSEWSYQRQGGMPVYIELAADQRVVETRHDMTEHVPAKWKRSGQGVDLTPSQGEAKARTWKLKTRKSYFNQGKAFFFELQLVPDGDVSQPAAEWMDGPLLAGPLSGDCM